MKKILSIILIAGVASLASAQITTNKPATSTISNSNVFLDASTNFSTESGALPNVGKGIIIPSVNLVNFEFDTTLADGATFPTYFDGMLVYNNANGTTLTTGNRSSTATPVQRGFYYFENKNGATSGVVNTGIWTPIAGASPKVNVTNAEAVTNTTINGAAIYTIKGTFTTNGTSTAPTAYAPANPTIAGMTGLYRITIFKAGTGTVYANSVYSYDLATGNIITGSPLMSVVYPAATYDYVLEYTK